MNLAVKITSILISIVVIITPFANHELPGPELFGFAAVIIAIFTIGLITFKQSDSKSLYVFDAVMIAFLIMVFVV